MKLPLRENFTFTELAQNWSAHRVTVQDIEHYCEQGQLEASIHVKTCEVIAFINNPEFERDGPDDDKDHPWVSVGVCHISGVFGFSYVHLSPILHGETETIYYLWPRGRYRIYDWLQEKPRAIGRSIEKLYQDWQPRAQDECEEQIRVFGAYPVEYLVPPGSDARIQTRTFSSKKLREFKRAVPNYDNRILLEYDQTQFSYSDLRITSDAVSVFEEEHITSGKGSTASTQASSESLSSADWKFTYREPKSRNDLSYCVTHYLKKYAQEHNGEAPSDGILWKFIIENVLAGDAQAKKYAITYDEDEKALCHSNGMTHIKAFKGRFARLKIRLIELD